MTADPANVEAARSAGLHYVSDQTLAGIQRRRRGKSFIYLDPAGRRITDKRVLSRIKSLVIPPAWRDVWICPDADGHLQATGRDAAGRKQHRYHPDWRKQRDEAKYDHLIDFAKALPTIRRRVARDLRRRGLPREKVLALVIQLLEKTLIRVGNDEYAKNNHHFGLTTLHRHHVRFSKGVAIFDFTGKSNVHRKVELHDRRLARLIRVCQHLPGQHLFRYRDDDGTLHDVGSHDVNDYLRSITGQDFTAKDFRTWAGTVLAARTLCVSNSVVNPKRGKKNIVRAVKSVAEQLGNTPAVCRKCYIHPAILDAYLDGRLEGLANQRSKKSSRKLDLPADQLAVLFVLES